ncbi:MAG: IS30 family transposase [Bacteroidales bacterium]|nr:IS30 family transposase [Bacteroidales bacterium]
MYKQLSREQRYAIYLGLQEKKTYTAIARQINCSVSTVSREVRRNSNRHGRYLFQNAVELTIVRRERSSSNRKTPNHILKRALNLLIEEDWSPKQISGYLKREGINISHERIYREIRADETGLLKKHCRHKMKYRRHKWHKRKSSGRTLIPNRISIHQRPVEADGTRFGDWEMDLVIGKGLKSAVLTMIERKTNMFLQTKLTSKKPDVVAKAAWRLLLPYKANVLTITTDNGSEFMNHQWLTKHIGATVYFADPFCSGQKGAVENANKLFRQYFPKGTDFRLIEQSQFDAIQAKINRRPREKLIFSSPIIEFFKLLK